MIKPKYNSRSRNTDRNPRRRRYKKPSSNNLGAFFKAPLPVAPTVNKDGFTTVKRRPHHSKARRVRTKPHPPALKPSSNPFNVLSSSPPKKDVAVLPKINRAPTKLAGAWVKKVSFKNDSETLMKPTPVETREYEKGSAPTEFVLYPKEEEYLKLKRSKNAWRPNHLKTTESLKVTIPLPTVPTYIGSWADGCDSDSDTEDEDEIVLDTMGRPTIDNSAW